MLYEPEKGTSLYEACRIACGIATLAKQSVTLVFNDTRVVVESDHPRQVMALYEANPKGTGGKHMNFRQLARQMVDRAREQIRADLQAQRYPEVVPVPMAEHLASLAPLPPPHDDDDEEPDPDDCAHVWHYTGTAYGGDDPSYRGEGRVYCEKCGTDGDG